MVMVDFVSCTRSQEGIAIFSELLGIPGVKKAPMILERS